MKALVISISLIFVGAMARAADTANGAAKPNAGGGLHAHIEQAPLAPPVTDHTRQKFFEALGKKGFYRLAACGQVANIFLSTIGLPPTGQASPIQGKRGPFDRGGETADRPTFNDELIGETKPSVDTKISAKPEGSDGWRLEIVRTRGDLTANARGYVAKSSFRFQASSQNGKPVCDAKEYEFGVAASAKEPLKMRKIPIDECATDFLINPSIPGDHFPPEKKDTFAWLRQDCITALHYSGEAQQRSKKP